MTSGILKRDGSLRGGGLKVSRAFGSVETGAPDLGSLLGRGTTLAFNTVGEWIERSRSRRVLASLDDRLLGDLGLSRTQADTEARRPFWRA